MTPAEFHATLLAQTIAPDPEFDAYADMAEIGRRGKRVAG